ncbi:MAG: thioesterase family protein [Ginsengibacter sp.]
MFAHRTQIRIHYALTDQMGVVYHGHYAQFYEIGRTESLRSLGFNYKDMEAEGIILPVTDIHSRFLRPARYDDLITVVTTLREIPTHHKIVFHSEIYNQQDELLNVGDVTLFFMEAKTMKRKEMPPGLKEKLKEFFSENAV